MNNLCKVCFTATRQINHPKFGVYHSCDHCGFISKDKDDHISTQAQQDIYDYHHNSIDDPVYVEYFNNFLDKAVFPNISDGKYALDFGSGPSPVLATMLQDTYGYQVDIYDLFYSPVRSYLTETYDLITLTEVLEHLEDPIHYFELFVKHLNENGILAVMTHFHTNNDVEFLNWHYIRDRSHISFFTDRTFEILAKKANLQIIYTDHKKCITLRKQTHD
ncbi:MAG: class I SAM-dependent methyltransferase [Firmicutes bacterium HGW-Firmicutes-10]|jgi:predicted DNA binding CopG/RHH family protein|nr:MAG: class I SAM-dependent methyltransferase [Firmicutes bacterium HGW-Firmicutes-10]